MSDFSSKFKDWFLQGSKPEANQEHHTDAWWRVMCLTGVDYFSTLGYQPGIAFLASGVLSPVATFILVLVTLFGALPTYAVVAKESPNGQGSVAILEKMLPGWQGKALVLALLGFAATAFIITITLSAADAAAHILGNPAIPEFLRERKIEVTIFLLGLLGALFLKGFKEAIGLSFFIVASYLSLSAVIIGKGCMILLQHSEYLENWQHLLLTEYPNPLTMIGVAVVMFPKLALGLSGFETGVAVMPLVSGDPSDTPENPAGRIRNARLLLASAAGIMSVFLILSSIVTTVLIPAPLFEEGADANGRALSYLAHEHLGHAFGTVYDVSTILILWFAGASAIAGLLSLVPKYLPRFGMAPSWSAAVRPLVVFFTVVAFGVTYLFKADVDAQAAAYATGVLVLITSAAIAATICVWNESAKKRWFMLTISFIFVYTSFANMSERPEGVQIALFFITSILGASVISRALRSTELRVEKVLLDPKALSFVEQALENKWGEIRILAHRHGMRDFKDKEERSRRIHSVQVEEGDFIFLEVELSDASDFSEDLLQVTGYEEQGFKILRCANPAVPNAIAAVLLDLRNRTSKVPHVYFNWTDGHPIAYTFKYIFFGEGETASITREILRSAEPLESLRPIVHVG